MGFNLGFKGLTHVSHTYEAVVVCSESPLNRNRNSMKKFIL